MNFLIAAGVFRVQIGQGMQWRRTCPAHKHSGSVRLGPLLCMLCERTGRSQGDSQPARACVQCLHSPCSYSN